MAPVTTQTASGFEPAYERAFARVFGLEGGLADHPADHGGLTQFGVSLQFLRGLGVGGGGDVDGNGSINGADILAVTPQISAALFYRHFWSPSGAAAMVPVSEELATKVFEMAVVSGPMTATRCLQRALVDCRAAVAVDGRFGGETFDAAMRLSRAALAGELVQAMRRRCAERFLSIVAADKSQLVFLLGWIRRALDLTT